MSGERETVLPLTRTVLVSGPRRLACCRLMLIAAVEDVVPPRCSPRDVAMEKRTKEATRNVFQSLAFLNHECGNTNCARTPAR